jgi:hypothetical protein
MTAHLTPLDLTLSLLLVALILLWAFFGERAWCLVAHRSHRSVTILYFRHFTMYRTVCHKCGQRSTERVFHYKK